MEKNKIVMRKEKRNDNSSLKSLFFFRKIGKQGDSFIIRIPKPLIPMIRESGFLGRKIKVILEKVNDSEND